MGDKASVELEHALDPLHAPATDEGGSAKDQANAVVGEDQRYRQVRSIGSLSSTS